MYSIEISASAKSDIEEILSYIKDTLGNPKAASNLADLMTKEISALSRHPFSGTPVQDRFLANYGFRFVLIKNFKAFYIVSENGEEKTVQIVRVLYARRDYETILSEEITQ
ncbi:MAG: type II toxin-antitoxin system RelE/ParE family toxin [Treponema sp.]|nr:type II toxin-antitoxin system RelE/ParE family toxin [Treponema sp.]